MERTDRSTGCARRNFALEKSQNAGNFAISISREIRLDSESRILPVGRRVEYIVAPPPPPPVKTDNDFRSSNSVAVQV